MKDMIEIAKDHYIIIIGSFFVIRLVELILRRTVKRLFGVVLFTGKTVVKPLGIVRKTSWLDWLLIIIIGGLAVYMFII